MRSTQPPQACIHHLFAEQAALRPQAPAVRSGDTVLTYAELALRARRLARRLRSHGVGPDVPVGLCVDRSPEMIVALLAILEAGGGYLPIDPGYPRQRLAFMLEDAAVPVVVTQRRWQAALPEGRGVAVLVDDEAADPGPEDSSAAPAHDTLDQLAYINYTSGSTGVPKGVEVLHRGVVRLVRDVDYVTLTPDTTLLHASTLSFDASTFEIWGALLNGGCCALHDEALPTARGLGTSIARHGVTTMWLTTSLFNAVVDDEPGRLRGLRELVVGGEALSVDHVRRAQAALPGTRIVNGYGPTEGTTFTCCHRIPPDLDSELRSIPIGRPLRGTRVHVLDERGVPVAAGVEGELFIGGDGLARGYLNRPELTAERFVPDPFGADGDRLYRTGDTVRRTADGDLEFVGRVDGQVKIRGFRIEAGELEAALLRHAAIRRCAVVPRDDAPGGRRLVAYLVAGDHPAPDNGALREFLLERLPEHMLPAAFVWLGDLPLTANGKLDRAALPAPTARPRLGRDYVAPSTAMERRLAATWGDVLGIEEIGIDDPFFDLGGDSLRALRVVAALRRQGLEVPVVRLFEHPAIRDLARHLEDAGRSAGRGPGQPAPTRSHRDAVAVVGMAGRFPGAASVEAFWANLCDGVDSTTFFTDAELDPAVPASLREDPAYVAGRGILPDADRFDAAFFGVTPAEAAVMDPQQRLLLEVAWEALERSGHVPGSFPGDIGVFAGKYNDSYSANNVRTRPDLVEQVGAFTAMVATEKDYVAPRLAHKLDLTGPAISVHTACSTSLVAVCQAVESLRRGECDLALAGGASITVPVRSGHLHQEGAMLSADGRTRPFDAAATGTTFSDGVAVVVLRRLADALADGDQVHAVIRGVAVNNDGARRASFTAPSVRGQAAVIARAQADAGVHPRSISYVEAHGTATPLGDPIEVEALTQAFRAGTGDTGFCALGSVKGNVGHLTIAAGAAGLIKTALALHHRTIPPTAHFQAPNPAIDFAASPFHVASTRLDWPGGAEPRRAGVSSFGVGGTNAHVVLEEAPPLPAADAARPEQLLLVSARTPAALDAATAALAAHLRERPDASLPDVAFTLQAGRRGFAHRRMAVCRSAAEAAEALGAAGPRRVVSHHLATGVPEVAFMFPGQGAQSPGMGRGLSASEPVFRAALDRCAEILRPHLGGDLRERLLAAADGAGGAEALRQTGVAQPAIFAVEYALATLWRHWGLEPRAMIGHSLGEFVCAVLAGVMSLEDALGLVAARGRLMQELPAGSMLAVVLSVEALGERLRGRPSLAVAAENAPGACVVAGPTDEVARLQAELEGEGIGCRALATSHAFHSPMVEPAIEPFRQLVGRVPLAAPRLPFVSGVSGTWITAEQATDPGYWARHMREPVRFSTGIRTLCADGPTVLLEVGPGATLGGLARRQLRDPACQAAISSLGEAPDGEVAALLDAAGQLWLRGVDLDWRALGGGRRRRVVLPTYPFERQRFWIDPAPPAAAAPAPVPAAVAPAADQTAAELSAREERTMTPTAPQASSHSARLAALRELFEEVTGLDLTGADPELSFVELGLDSLFLTQVALQLQRRFRIRLTFRQLVERYPSLSALARHIDAELPEEPAVAAAIPAVAAAAPAPVLPPVPAPPPAVTASAPAPAVGGAAWDALRRVVDEQLRLMAQQLALLGAAAAQPVPAGVPLSAHPAAAANGAQPAAVANGAHPAGSNGSRPPAPAGPAADGAAASATAAGTSAPEKPFGAIARITTATQELTALQRARLDAFLRRHTARTRESKRLTQANRSRLADPRAVTGFRPSVKELVYPITVDRSSGSHVWDVDGNEYVDVLNGFGASLLGWQPPFVTEAVSAQLARGHEIGPMHPLAGEVADLVCELTGFERVGFCNTGSEAVMGAIRIARTVTGRSLVAMFAGSYHGGFDEVVVRAARGGRAVPAAPGILPETAQNVLVLEYGTPETLEVLRSRADELAAVLVEPVQSRRPELQPREFLHELRRLTERSGTACVMDEMVTGFRTAPGGAQEHFGVRGDIATYGKAVGGGLPIGIIAGRREWMDALDGGHWEYGDASMPTVGVTYFAGTFVRHPLALAAARAVLEHLRREGPALQRRLTETTAEFAEGLNRHLRASGAPLEIRHFGSLWRCVLTDEHLHGELLFMMLRDRGVHVLDGFPCFFTTAHSRADVDLVAAALRDSVAEMQEAGFLVRQSRATVQLDASRPPVPGARLGRDASHNPAWFLPNPEQPGKYVLLEARA